MTDSTAASYDRVATAYAANVGGELSARPLERGLLSAFAALVGPDGRVADVGCGPGHVTAHLAELGLDARGLDLSEGMIDVARESSPEIVFEVASMLDLPIADDGLDGAVAWFSVIHVEEEARPRAYAELARAVRPDGWLLLGFHVSDATHAPGDVERVSTWWDLPVELAFHFLDPAAEAPALAAAGWREIARLEREPMIASEPQTRRCYLLLRRSP